MSESQATVHYQSPLVVILDNIKVPLLTRMCLGLGE